MNNLLIKLKKRVFNFLPSSTRASLLSRYRSLTYITPEQDHRICFDSIFYGKACFILNPIYRIEKEILYNHFYDKKTLLYFKRIIQRGDFIFDIGANIGSMTIPLASCTGATGKVFSFEPGPILFERLEKNVMANQNICNHIECVNLGLSDNSGHLYWEEEMCNRGNAILSKNKAGIKVKVTTIDDFITKNSIEKLDFIKIDVEGMEFNVIKGAINTIKKFAPIILFETNVTNDSEKKIEKIFNLLKAQSYDFFEIDIPERQLTDDPQKFNFIPTYYPKLPCDTLAIPKKHQIRITREP